MQTVSIVCSPSGTPLHRKQANRFIDLAFPFSSIVQQYAEENWLHLNCKSSNPNLVDCSFCHFLPLRCIRLSSGHSGSNVVELGHNTTGRVKLTGCWNFTWQGSSFKTGETTSSGKSVLTISKVISVSFSRAPLGMLTVQP